LKANREKTHYAAGGFRLELPLSIIPNCADLALSQALWTFMRQLFRLFLLVPIQRPALLAPAIISALGYPDPTGRIGNASRTMLGPYPKRR
jgi:hypothetical protein